MNTIFRCLTFSCLPQVIMKVLRLPKVIHKDITGQLHNILVVELMRLGSHISMRGDLAMKYVADVMQDIVSGQCVSKVFTFSNILMV